MTVDGAAALGVDAGMAAPAERTAHAHANAAAMANWLWLTALPRAGDALLAGDTSLPLRQALERQFARVVAMDRARPDASAELASLPDRSFDYIVLPGVFEWWPRGAPDLLDAARRLLRPDGWLGIAGTNPLYLSGNPGALSRVALGLGAIVAASRSGSSGWPPARVGAALRQAGFVEVRSYGVAPTYAQPLLIVPRTRNAALAQEWDRRRQVGGNAVRIALATAGLSDLLYGGWLFLASP